MRSLVAVLSSSLTWVNKMNENWVRPKPILRNSCMTQFDLSACQKFTGWTCWYESAFELPKAIICVFFSSTNPQVTLHGCVLLMNITNDWIDKVKDNNATITQALEMLNLSTLHYDDLLVMLNGYHGTLYDVHKQYTVSLHGILPCVLLCKYICKLVTWIHFLPAVVLPVCVVTSFIICFLFLVHMAANVQYVMYILVDNICPHDLHLLKPYCCAPVTTSSLHWYVQWCFVYRLHKVNFLFWFAYVIRFNM